MIKTMRRENRRESGNDRPQGKKSELGDTLDESFEMHSGCIETHDET
jgi:hypothetical protein